MISKSKGKKKRTARSKSGILLGLLNENPGLSAKEIGHKLGWSSKTISNIITRLEKSGEIEFKIFPSTSSLIFPSIAEINKTLEQVDHQYNKLESMKNSLKKRETETFEKVVEAQMRNDASMASIYANHCAQIRDLSSIVERGELILKRLLLIFGLGA
jgi:division protein CdvB (Snf7/Vps24/ESCRT-III family)